jgi:hypothetical protein
MSDSLAEITSAEAKAEIAQLAIRFRRANGPVMRLLNTVSKAAESALTGVPSEFRAPLESAVTQALEAANGVAAKSSALGERGSMTAVMATGAAGGAGGFATAIVELPFTITLLLNAIQSEARAAGLDLEEDWVRAECLRVFAAGSPLAMDDGVNTSFIAMRFAATGATMQNLIKSIAPKLALVLGQKVAAQAVPLVGSISGAALNLAFLNYYREIARIRFALLNLSEVHGTERVLSAFQAAAEPPRITRA